MKNNLLIVPTLTALVLILGACSNDRHGKGMALDPEAANQKDLFTEQDWNPKVVKAADKTAGDELVGVWAEACKNDGDPESSKVINSVQKKADGSFFMKTFKLSYYASDCVADSFEADQTKTLSEYSLTLKSIDRSLLNKKQIVFLDTSDFKLFKEKLNMIYAANVTVQDGANGPENQVPMIIAVNDRKIPIFFKRVLSTESSYASHQDFVDKMASLNEFGMLTKIFAGTDAAQSKLSDDETASLKLDMNTEFLGG